MAEAGPLGAETGEGKNGDGEAAALARRLAYYNLTPADAERIRALGAGLGDTCASLIDDFYEHLQAQPDTRDLLARPETLAALKRAQSAYFNRLFAGVYDAAYVRDRLGVGRTHHRIGLRPDLYLGAYSKYLVLLMHALASRAEGRGGLPAEPLAALVKIVFLDIGLAIDTYIEAEHEQLRALHARYQELLDTLDAVVLEIDPRTLGFTCVSRRAETLIGDPTRCWLEERDFWPRLIHAEDRERTLALCREAAENGGAHEFEFRAATAEGRALWLHATCRATRGADGRVEALRGMLVDVTARRLAEEAVRAAEEREGRLRAELRQTQKLEALGLLAGGVAHDFNNLLSAIIGFSDLLTLQLPEGSKGSEYAHLIRHAGESAAGLTRQLLAFSRRQVLQPEIVDLGALVAGMTAMLVRVLGERIEIVEGPAADARLVNADRGQLEQVVLNLAVNARDAMPDGGRLRLAVVECDLEDSLRKEHPDAAPGRHVMLSVQDTGRGMDEETVKRIFEPFFTTKPAGKGTGLGLATVYGIVRQSGGLIQVVSAPGLGTTFRVFLPSAAGAPREVAARTAGGGLEGNETILVVDDAEAVVRLATEVLERYGYSVVPAEGGEAALTAARRHTGPLDLLLTDVVMPGLTGPEL
ncbi:MAG: PAS domain-containing protein, partial [Planctomycetes bacterium]|nr:PAS domain-containing protein [Planctomycetota bacterium]